MNVRGAEHGKMSDMLSLLRLTGANLILHRVPVVVQRDEGTVGGGCINTMKGMMGITPSHPANKASGGNAEGSKGNSVECKRCAETSQ